MVKVKIAQSAIGLLLPGFLIIFLSDAPYSHFTGHDAMVEIAFKHSGKRVQECDEEKFIKQEAERYAEMQKTRQGVPMDVGKKTGCSRERFPVFIELSIDGEKILAKEYPPMGIQKDGASFIYERFLVKPGSHRALMGIRDGGPGAPLRIREEILELKPGEVALLNY